MKTDLKKTEKRLRIALLILLIAYVIFLLWYTIFSRKYDPARIRYRGEVFWSIRAAAADKEGTMLTLIVLNFLMLVPFGFAAAWLTGPEIVGAGSAGASDRKTAGAGSGSRRPAARKIVGAGSRGLSGWKHFAAVTLAGLMFACLIETLQLLLRRGLFEYDDMIFNTAGAALGWLLYRITYRMASAWVNRPGALTQSGSTDQVLRPKVGQQTRSSDPERVSH